MANPSCPNPDCGSSEVKANGRSRKGQQRYLCKSCGKSFTPGADGKPGRKRLYKTIAEKSWVHRHNNPNYNAEQRERRRKRKQQKAEE